MREGKKKLSTFHHSEMLDTLNGLVVQTEELGLHMRRWLCQGHKSLRYTACLMCPVLQLQHLLNIEV